MRAQIELRAVVAGLPLDRVDFHLRLGKRVFRLHLFGSVRIACDIAADPVAQPALHVSALFEGPDLVAHNALEIVRKARRREDVGQTRRKIGVSRSVGVVVLARLVHGLSAQEHGVVRVLPVAERQEPVL